MVPAILAFGLLLAPQLAAAQQQWWLTGQTQGTRVLSAVVGLGDGRVLITGGVETVASAVALTTAEIHDPATGTTVAAPPPPFAAYGSAAIRLADGRALVVGGATFGGANGIAEYAIYDPVAGTWTSGVTPHRMVLPAVAALPDGRILVAGGLIEKLIEVYDEFGNLQYSYNEDQAIAADIFDPATSMWTPVGEMNGPHQYPGFATLGDGRIIVVGGANSRFGEIYDPAANTWTQTAQMHVEDAGISSSVRLTDGRIAHINALSGVEVYDPAANTWTLATAKPETTAYSFSFALPGGRLMVAGGIEFDPSTNTTGSDLATTAVYDPATDSWTAGPDMNATHAVVRPALMPNGRFAVFGGYIAATAAIEITGLNSAPVANAGPDIAASTCLSCLGGVAMNASGSTDAEGDALTYQWSVGGNVVLASTQPAGIIALSPGTWTVTLTVTDALGESGSDTAEIVVTNVDDGYLATIANLQAQVAALTAQQTILQAELAACQANGGGADIAPLMNSFEQHFRSIFKDSSFELPGNTAVDELERLLKVIKKLDRDDQRTIYRALGGRKKHNGHKGRWSSHWDDDCDYDEDGDHDRARDGKKR